MKKMLISAITILSMFRVLAADPTINDKVLNAFERTFKNVQNVHWSTYTHAYEVKFEQNKITCKITYDKEGNILKTLRYYGEEQLPILVLTKVKNRFASKTIFGVVEVSSEEGTIYHITLEDEKTWLEILSDDYGSLTVEKKYRKA